MARIVDYQSRVHTERMLFDLWMKSVNKHVSFIVGFGMTTDDLVDCPYMDWWEDGLSPKQAARRAIRESGGEF